MARDEDFSAFVESRWGRLVRSAVLLGCSSSEAEDVVQSALVRCLVHWSKVRNADDPDAYVHRVLINTTGQTTRLWRGCGDDSPVVLSPDGQHAITRNSGIVDVSTGSVDRIDGVGSAVPDGTGWEDNEHILFHVPGSSSAERVIVRCSITTQTCERAGNDVRLGPGESLEFAGPGEH
jgi:hypothetical protein